jgi:hypothetical protein
MFSRGQVVDAAEEDRLRRRTLRRARPGGDGSGCGGGDAGGGGGGAAVGGIRTRRDLAAAIEKLERELEVARREVS